MRDTVPQLAVVRGDERTPFADRKPGEPAADRELESDERRVEAVHGRTAEHATLAVVEVAVRGVGLEQCRELVRQPLQHRLELELNLQLIAHEEASCLERHVPVQAKVLPVELCFGAEPGDGLANWIGASPVERHIQADFARQAVDGQIANDRELLAGAGNASTLERDGWILRDIEEVG